MDRRNFLKNTGLTLAFLPLLSAFDFSQSKSFFSIQKIKGRYFLIDPEGNKFFSIGLNHVDAAGLRYSNNSNIWFEKYENSMEKWLKEGVRNDFLEWGFNTMGWNQEVVTLEKTNHRHSRSFTPEEYAWLNLPYCHMLNFADFHQWEVEIRYPDFFSNGFIEWCDYVARDQASRLADDPNLIGYFYIDCPTWIHTRKDNRWKGPLFDPERLKTEAGRKELFEIATQYYKVTHDAVRRYDKNHLIFGDRYEAKEPIADEVIKAAIPYVDALSFQHFSPPEAIVATLKHWHNFSKLPTLVADASHSKRYKETGYWYHTLDGYRQIYDLIKTEPSCIGYHLCGAYLENRARKKGLLNEKEKPYGDVIKMITEVNTEMKKWVKNF